MARPPREPDGQALRNQGTTGRIDTDAVRSAAPPSRGSAGFEAAQPITTQALFGKRREILLSHGDSLYRLRITSKDKLILTK